MAARTTLSDLRNGIQGIYREMMREQGGWEASNDTVLKRIKAERAEELRVLMPQLVDMALTKLLNEVSNRKGGGRAPGAGDLFGDYRIPRIVTIARGKKKDTAKLSFREAELYVKSRSKKSASDRYGPLRRLLDDCREHVKSVEDTLEILIDRKRAADELALR